MSDLLLAALLCYALGLSVHHRSRFGLLGAAVASLCLGVLLLLSLSGWYSRRVEEMGGWGALLMVLVGPGVVPGAVAGLPFSQLLAHFPLAGRGLMVALCVGACAVLFHAASRPPHESEEADRLRRVGLSFLFPAILAVALPLFFALANLLAEP